MIKVKPGVFFFSTLRLIPKALGIDVRAKKKKKKDQMFFYRYTIYSELS